MPQVLYFISSQEQIVTRKSMWLSFNFLGGSGGSGDEAEPLLRPRDSPLGKSSGARGTVIYSEIECLLLLSLSS